MIKIYPLKLEELCHTEQIPYDLSEFEWSAPLKRAFNLKIEKMKNLDEFYHPLYTYFLIVEESTNKGIGCIGFKGMEHGCMEVGYGIGKAFEGQGYTSRALEQIVKWAFEHTFCHTITAKNVLKDNVGSQRVLEKNGFTMIQENETTLDYHLKNHHFRFDEEKAGEYIHRKGAYALIEKSNKFCVIQLRDTHFLIGGGVDDQEDIQACLEREAIEETGYTLKSVRYLTTMLEFCQNRFRTKLYLLDADIFLAELDEKITERIELDHELTWIEKEEIHDKMCLSYQKLGMYKLSRGDLYGLR